MEDRVPLTEYHLEGDAQLWYQLLNDQEELLTWKNLAEGLHAGYGPTDCEDVLEDLKKLSSKWGVYMTTKLKLKGCWPIRVECLHDNRWVASLVDLKRAYDLTYKRHEPILYLLWVSQII